MATRGIDQADWQAWESNPITRAYFEEIKDQLKEWRSNLEKISTEQDLARNYFQLKGQIMSLEFALKHIQFIIEDSQIQGSEGA